jgi:glycosyltransferase involved in cell wall biosynthesis
VSGKVVRTAPCLRLGVREGPMSPATVVAITETRSELAAQPEISIVMPCLNEAETLPRCIRKAQAALAEHGVSGEIIVADNGSTDGSQDIAMSLGARVVRVQDKGYGSALRGGIAAARAEYVLMGDADDSYDFGHLDRFMEALAAGAELVMGNRFKGGIEPHAMPPLHRYLGNPVLTAFGRIFFGSPVRDFHCGLRAFRRDAYERMQLRGSGMEFASEMVVRATLLDMRIAEVPTTLVPDGRTRPPHLRTWRDGWRHLRFLLLYSPRFLFFVPGYLLMLLGSILFFTLLTGPVTIHNVQFDVDTMLFGVAAILVGFQIVSFAVFAKILGVTQGLLPPNQELDRLFNHITLEVGLLVGIVLSLLGLAISAGALIIWGNKGFGPLDPVHTIRIVSPGILCLTLGIETVFASFFLSIVGYAKKA